MHRTKKYTQIKCVESYIIHRLVSVAFLTIVRNSHKNSNSVKVIIHTVYLKPPDVLVHACE